MVTITILRHAPVEKAGRIAGRTDVGANCSDQAALLAVKSRLKRLSFDTIWSSPAKRCLQTCHALELAPQIHSALWEQDFGEWEGIASDTLPDLGPLSPAELAEFQPPGGESFNDMSRRVRPLLQAASQSVLVVAHAGTARAALSMAIGAHAISFAIAPLSLTILSGSCYDWAVEGVNLGSLE